MSDPQESKLDSKTIIISVATRLFAKFGLDKCSTREIAKQSDTNISLISYYFGGKEGLYKEVMRTYAEQVKSKAQPIVDEIQKDYTNRDHFIKEMRDIISYIIQTRLSGPDMSKIFSREKLSGLPYSKDIHEEIFYPMILNFYRLIESAKRNGFVKTEVNSALLFIMISEGVWGFYEIIDCNTKLSRDGEVLHKDTDKLTDQILDLFLTGVLK